MKWYVALGVVLFFVAAQERSAISLVLFGPKDISVSAESIVLYATDWCGYCEKTRRLLRRYDIPFEEVDVERSAEGRRQFQAIGGRGVPMLNIDGTIVHGYEPQRILKLAAGDLTEE